MTINEVYEFYGCNWSEMARELKLGVNTYKNWVKNGYIPMPTQLRIEKGTKGKLKADINKTKERK